MYAETGLFLMMIHLRPILYYLLFIFEFVFLLEICLVLVELPLYILMLFFCDDSSIHERLPLKSHSV